jgi:hypothetical protein
VKFQQTIPEDFAMCHVDSPDPGTQARALAAGGTRYMEPASADGYTFAMIRNPEGNPMGLIKPLNGDAA